MDDAPGKRGSGRVALIHVEWTEVARDLGEAKQVIFGERSFAFERGAHLNVPKDQDRGRLDAQHVGMPSARERGDGTRRSN
jgi:hypothetical protein